MGEKREVQRRRNKKKYRLLFAEKAFIVKVGFIWSVGLINRSLFYQRSKMRIVGEILIVFLLILIVMNNGKEEKEEGEPHRIYFLKRVNGAGCPYTASWLVHINLYRKVTWYLDITKMEAATFSM